MHVSVNENLHSDDLEVHCACIYVGRRRKQFWSLIEDVETTFLRNSGKKSWRYRFIEGGSSAPLVQWCKAVRSVRYGTFTSLWPSGTDPLPFSSFLASDSYVMYSYLHSALTILPMATYKQRLGSPQQQQQSRRHNGKGKAHRFSTRQKLELGPRIQHHIWIIP